MILVIYKLCALQLLM